MKLSIDGHLTRASIRQLKRDLALLSLSQKQKNQILKQGLKRIKQEANRNKTKQQSPDGSAWQPRKKAKYTYTATGKAKPKKMLMKILKKSSISVSGDVGVLGFRSKRRSEVAAIHQYGSDRVGKR